MLFNKVKEVKPLSNKWLEQQLNNLTWHKASNDKHEWEFVKLRQVQEDNIVLAMILAQLPRKKIGPFVYTQKNGLLERYNPKVIPTKREIIKNIVSKIGSYDFDLEKRGVIDHID